MNKTCNHPALGFGSGDYYIFCSACDRKWALMGTGKEYGQGLNGERIGADPGKAQAGFTHTHLWKPEDLK